MQHDVGWVYDNINERVSLMNALTNWLVIPPAVFCLRSGLRLYRQQKQRLGCFYLTGTILMLLASTISSVYHMNETHAGAKNADLVFATILMLWTIAMFFYLAFYKANKNPRLRLQLLLFAVVSSAAITVQINGIPDETDQEKYTLGRIQHTIWHALATFALLLLVI